MTQISQLLNLLSEADVSIRDYTGKHAVHYLTQSCSSSMKNMLTPPVFIYQKPRYVTLCDIFIVSALFDVDYQNLHIVM